MYIEESFFKIAYDSDSGQVALAMLMTFIYMFDLIWTIFFLITEVIKVRPICFQQGLDCMHMGQIDKAQSLWSTMELHSIFFQGTLEKVFCKNTCDSDSGFIHLGYQGE